MPLIVMIHVHSDGHYKSSGQILLEKEPIIGHKHNIAQCCQQIADPCLMLLISFFGAFRDKDVFHDEICHHEYPYTLE